MTTGWAMRRPFPDPSFERMEFSARTAVVGHEAHTPPVPRRPLTADQLAAIRQDVLRGQRALEAFIRGEGPAPGFETLASMPVDPTRPRPEPKRGT
jgi:hypothetical protein